MVRKIVDIIDTLIFLWLAVTGFVYIWTGTPPALIYAGCALVCTGIYWKNMNKDRIINTIENTIKLFLKP